MKRSPRSRNGGAIRCSDLSFFFCCKNLTNACHQPLIEILKFDCCAHVCYTIAASHETRIAVFNRRVMLKFGR
jgi:hypothetical protein